MQIIHFVVGACLGSLCVWYTMRNSYDQGRREGYIEGCVDLSKELSKKLDSEGITLDLSVQKELDSHD